MYQLSKLIFGTPDPLAPIIMGIKKLPSTAESKESGKENHRHAVHGEQLVVGFRRYQVTARREQVNAISEAKMPPMKRKK